MSRMPPHKDGERESINVCDDALKVSSKGGEGEVRSDWLAGGLAGHLSYVLRSHSKVKPFDE